MKAEKTTYNNEYYISKFRGRTTEDQLLKHATELKEKRSITPETHKSRTLVKNTEELTNFNAIKNLEIFKKQVSLGIEEHLMMQKEEPDNQFYVDEYQYRDSSTSHVLRFGINTFNKSLREEIINYNKMVKGAISEDLTEQLTTKVQEFFISIISNSDLIPKSSDDILKNFEKQFKETKETKKEDKLLNKCVKLFLKTHTLDEFIVYTKTHCSNVEVNDSLLLKNLDTISIPKSQVSLANTQNYIDISKNISHLTTERALIESAVEYFKDNPNTKTMLLDILERNLQTTLIEDIQKKHTVVLYNTGTKILVIDPSNPQFSSHLANFANYIEVSYSDKIKIYQPLEKAEEKGLLGSQSHQWRDCIDVAVKLAFELNQSSQKFSNLKEVLSSEIIGIISNNDLINQSILEDITKEHFVVTPLRIQQNSNIKIGQFFYKFSKKLKENLDSVKNQELLRENYTNLIDKIAQQKLSIKQSLEKVFSICESSCYQKIGLLEQTKNMEMSNLELLGKDFQEIMENDYE